MVRTRTTPTGVSAPDEAARQTVRDQFKTIELANRKLYHRRFSSPEAVLQWGKTDPVISQAWEVMGSSIQNRSWNGLGDQSRADLIATARGENALKAFNAAQVKLEADTLRIGGRAVPAITGGAWVIPQFLASNPMCARAKPRARLPHKDFKFTLQCSAFVNESELGSIGAAIARSLWDYTLNGGTATLTMGYIYGFSDDSPSGEEAIYFEVNIPLASSNSVALALSPSFYRSVLMSAVFDGISPTRGDCIPMKHHLKPAGFTPLQGQWSTDRDALASLGIKQK